MTKKVKKVEVPKPEPVVPVEVKVIGKLELDLGRGDLNSLRDKLNEVIDKLNGN